MSNITRTKNLPELALNDPHKNDDIAVVKRVTIQVDVSKLSGSTTRAAINPVQTEDLKID